MSNMIHLNELSRIEIDKVNRNTLVDIDGVQIDTGLPVERRMQQYLEQIKNPYCFLCGDTPVRVCFSSNGQDLGGKIKNYFTTLKQS